MDKRVGRWLRRGALAAAVVALAGAAQAGLPREFTLNRPSTTQFFMDYDDGDGMPNRVVSYGAPGDVGMLADVDGDTVADLILYRNGTWFIDLMNNGTVDRTFFLGDPAGGDVPVVGDFLGNGKAGFGVYRKSTGVWYLDRDGDGTVDFVSTFGGGAQDIPVVADFDGDGRADRAIYRAGLWYVDLGFDGTLDAIYALGGAPQDVPVAGDFDGDWKADIAVFRDGAWYIDYGRNSTVDRILFYGGAGDRPLFAPVNPASSRFVRTGGGGGACTQAVPCGTIAGALAVAQPGEKIRISAGSYPENVNVTSRSNLTFVGAGVNATHLLGGGGIDAFVAAFSTGITVRNLHVASPTSRGLIAQASQLTLDRVSTIGNHSHNVLAASFGGTPATLVVNFSNLNGSQNGNGLRLETPSGATSATVTRTTIDGNGTALGAVDDGTGGRGIEAYGSSQLTLDSSSVSSNHFSGALFTTTSTAVIHDSFINLNGHNGIYFELGTSGDVYRNLMDTNGTLGTKGPTSGYNAIEVANNWTGPQMLIHENSILRSTTNGTYIGGGTATVANNTFTDNFVGVTIANTTNVTIRGNLFQGVEVTNEEGVFMQGPGVVAIIGGTGTGLSNTFSNYVNNPSIHCNGMGETATCPAGGNSFPGSNLPVAGCLATCTP